MVSGGVLFTSLMMGGPPSRSTEIRRPKLSPGRRYSTTHFSSGLDSSMLGCSSFGFRRLR